MSSHFLLRFALSAVILGFLFLFCSHNSHPTNHDQYSDAQFIDDMIDHHDGAVAMAKQGQDSGSHPELVQLCSTIIATQNIEMDSMQAWRERWYPDSGHSGGMHMDMGMMEIAADSTKPFDQRLLDAMISHHNAAIAMCDHATAMGEHGEIRALASAIKSSQQTEIVQMQDWHMNWFMQH